MSSVLVPATVPLHEFASRHHGISIVSYNVLLPNSQDGWWVFKYYDASTPNAARTWAHRQALLRETLLGAMADVVCLQEASGATFAADFEFMIEAGYGAAIHRKYRLRPAIFWRADAWTCIHQRHMDKVLLCVLRSVADPAVVISVLSCHLVAAPQPQRRFRQIFDALERLRKDLARLQIPPEEAAVVVAGDFNAAPEGTATHHLLSGGVVDAGFREPRWPERSLSSKPRRHGFAPFTEAYLHTLGRAPATLIGSRISGLLDGDGQPTAVLMGALSDLFDRFADGERMDWSAVESWLMAINRAVDRGSEHRKARAVVATKGEPWLSRAELVGLYAQELAEGKFWSVLHDLQVCGVLPAGERTLFAAALDHIYACNLAVLAAWDPLPEARRRALFSGGIGLPNDWHPSDHIPIGAVLGWPSRGG